MTHQDDSFAHLFTGTVIEREARSRATRRRRYPAWSRILSHIVGWLIGRVACSRRR